jgi:hypothetical protein
MDESTRWGFRRYAALLAAVALHLAVLAALMIASRSRSTAAARSESVQLIFLPRIEAAPVRSNNAPPRRVIPAPAILAVPLVLAPLSGSTAPSPASPADGHGTGVDWAAEARRALQAFEIRNREPRPVKPADDDWWPHAQRRPGEQFKTVNGDWIVWINSNCYQVASAAPSTFALGTSLPKTVCLRPPPAEPSSAGPSSAGP